MTVSYEPDLRESLRSGVRVIGNISTDTCVYSDGSHQVFLGGAALFVSLAAAKMGLQAIPVTVVGNDLNWIFSDARLRALNLSNVEVCDDKTCAFTIRYSSDGKVAGLSSAFGAAIHLTSHALVSLAPKSYYHICCRRPLDVRPIVKRACELGVPFSVDFFVSSAKEKIGELADLLHEASAIFLNQDEYAILCASIWPADCRAIVISDGPRLARILRFGEEVAVALPPTVETVEVTGAGDTLAGSMLASWGAGLNDSAALSNAVHASADHIVSPRFEIFPDGGARS